MPNSAQYTHMDDGEQITPSQSILCIQQKKKKSETVF